MAREMRVEMPSWEELYDLRPPARTLADVFRLMPETALRGAR